MDKFDAVQSAALQQAEQSRLGAYAKAVIEGRQALSGADLQGKAAKYGGWYAGQRVKAMRIWRLCGGTEIRHPHTGRRLLAVHACVSDFGDMVYVTQSGGTYIGHESRDGIRERFLSA